jgi:hypothetical protein
MKFNKRRHNRFRLRKGFTLAEALLATSLLAICASSSLLPFTSGASLQAEGVQRTAAAMLASDMMQRVETADFNSIIASYNGYLEPKGGLTDITGSVYTDIGYNNFSRTVSCEEVYLPQESGTGQVNFILIKVKVFYNDREVIELKKLKCRY